MDVNQLMKYLDYAKTVMEFVIVITPVVVGFFDFLKKKLHKQ